MSRNTTRQNLFTKFSPYSLCPRLFFSLSWSPSFFCLLSLCSVRLQVIFLCFIAYHHKFSCSANLFSTELVPFRDLFCFGLFVCLFLLTFSYKLNNDHAVLLSEITFLIPDSLARQIPIIKEKIVPEGVDAVPLYCRTGRMGLHPNAMSIDNYWVLLVPMVVHAAKMCLSFIKWCISLGIIKRNAGFFAILSPFKLGNQFECTCK